MNRASKLGVVFAMLAITSCSLGRGAGGGIGSSEPPFGASKPKVGQSGVEGTCEDDTSEDPNVAFEQTIADLGFSAAEAAAAVEGSHELVFVRQPWFEAPSTHPVQRMLTVTIMPQAVARRSECGGYVAVPVDVRIRDVQSGIEVALTGELSAYPSGDAHPRLGHVAIDGSFESTELARALALPPSAVSGRSADPFEVHADFAGGTWSASLVSVRGGHSCAVLETSATSTDSCSPYGAMSAGEPPQRVELSARFGTRSRMQDLLDSVRSLPALAMHWPDGSATSLHVDITPADFACAGQYSEERAENTSPQPRDMGLAPLELHLTTDDGKLDVNVPGVVRASVAVGQAWDGSAELDSALAPVAALSGMTLPMLLQVPEGDLGFLSVLLNVPVEGNDNSQLALDAYRPSAGAPQFPAVYEYSASRIACFTNEQPTAHFGSSLKPAAN